MKFSPGVIILIISVLAGCGQQQLLKARVFERKSLNGNRLLIRYEYEAGHKRYIDSATIGNVVIEGDSITVIIDPANPSRSIPDLTK